MYKSITVIPLLALLSACSGGGGSGFSDIIPDSSSSTVGCSITAKTPNESNITASSTATSVHYSVTTDGENCATTFTLNGETITSSGASAELTSSQLSAGTNVLQATATNSNGSASTTWTVTKNNSPVCSSQTPTPTGNVTGVSVPITMIAHATDADGDTLSYSWFSNGSAANSTYFAITSNLSATQAIFTPNSSFTGSNTIRADISDGKDTVSCAWTVAVSNSCSISSSSPSGVTALVSALGTTSTSFVVVPSDSSCALTWNLNGTPLSDTTAIVNLLSSSLNSGTNTLIATVSNGGNSASRTWTVTKNSAPSCGSQTPSATGTTMTHMQTQVFVANATDADADPLSFAWKFNNSANPSLFTSINTVGNASTVTFDPGLGQVGASQSIQAEISDDVDTNQCSWNLAVTDPNTLSITNCSPDTSTTTVVRSVGPDRTLSVSATGTSLSYVWKRDGVVVGGQTSPTYTVTPGSLAVGNYTLRADVTDSYGNTDHCEWAVKRNAIPVLSSIVPDNSRSGADYRMNYASTLPMSVVGSDANGDTLTYSWSLSPSANAALPTSTLPNNTFSPTTALLGAQTISVTATDGEEVSDPVQWDVEVNAFTPTCNTILTGRATSGSSGTGSVTGGKICTLVGNPSVGDSLYPGTGDSLKMRMQPTYIADDGSGNLFVSDQLNHAVWFWNRSGSPITRLGQTIAAGQINVVVGNGLAGRNSDNLTNNTYPTTAPASQFKLNTPMGIAWDSSEARLWVSDYGNNRIVAVGSTGAATTVFGSDPGPPIVTPTNITTGNTDGALGTSHVCTQPVGLWFDSAANWLYVACYGTNAIKKMNTTVGSNYTKGYIVVGRLSGTGYPYNCSIPTNCATTSGNEGGSIGASGIARANGPWDITGDSNGNIYWVEYAGLRLRMATTGSSSASFFAGNYTISSSVLTATDLSSTALTAGTLTTASVSLVGTPSKLVITGATASSSTICHPYLIQVQNSTSAAVNATAQVNINLAGGSGTFHTDSACSGGATTTTTSIANGTNQTTVYYKRTTTGSVTLTAVDSAGSSPLTTGSLAMNINTGTTPTKIVLLGSTSFAQNTCQRMLVQVQDASSIATAAGSARTVVLMDAHGPGTFYSDSGCTTPINSVTIGSSSSEAQVYYDKRALAGASEAITLAGNYSAANGNINGAIGSVTFRRPRGLAILKDVAGTGIDGFAVSTYDGHGVMFLNNTSGAVNFGSISVPTLTSAYIMGTGTGAYNFDNALANTAQIFQSHGVIFDTARTNMFVGDFANYRLRGMPLSTGTVNTTLNEGRQRAGYVGSATYAPDVFLNAPSEIFYDSTSRSLLYSDSSNGRVRSVDLLTGTVETLIGNGVGNGNVENQDPQSTAIRSPRGLTTMGNFVVYADQQASTATSQSCQIRAWNAGTSASFFNVNISSNTVATIAGNYAKGCIAWNTAPVNDGTVATDTKFYNPEGLTTDGTNIYFAAYNDHCIIKLLPNGTYSQHVGRCGTSGSTDGSTAMPTQTARLLNPMAVIVDPQYASDGNLFIVDQSQAATTLIRYVNFRTNATYGDGSVTVAGTTIPAAASGAGYVQTIFTSTGSLRWNGVAAFNTQICYGGGDVNATSGGATGAHNIICVDRSTGFTTLRIGPNDATTTHKGGASLRGEQEGLSTLTSSSESQHVRTAAPYGLTFDADGNLYISERLSHTIRMVRRWW
jgi:hypothetical protein